VELDAGTLVVPVAAVATTVVIKADDAALARMLLSSAALTAGADDAPITNTAVVVNNNLPRKRIDLLRDKGEMFMALSSRTAAQSRACILFGPPAGAGAFESR
jgi:hypothetical protein